MTTAYGERINIQKNHHVYRKNNKKNTRNGYKLVRVKKTAKCMIVYAIIFTEQKKINSDVNC